MRVEWTDISVSNREPIVTVPFVSADANILVSDAALDGQSLVIERL